MGSMETGRIRRMIKEHSRHPQHWGKHCCECNSFKWEWIEGKQLRKKYCSKWAKEVNPDKWGCFYLFH